ncbi:hypothetical protein HRbin12_00066 [bacterium HR12]|nr:hypothetical protein HRbin12_00066 [bacterium HR12]
MRRTLAKRLGPLRNRGGWPSERGAVATEYGLLLLFVALAIVLALTAFGLAVLRLIQAGADAFR